MGRATPCHSGYPLHLSFWLSSLLVILSEAKNLVGCAEMLRCTQHDRTLPDSRALAKQECSRLSLRRSPSACHPERSPTCHPGDPLLHVIPSAAKDLARLATRSFAALRMTLSGCPENNLTK